MDFFTKIDIPASNIRIDYTSHIAFFGSCFADNISAQFTARKFNVLANPFGTVYNPISLESQVKAIADGKIFGENDVFQDTRCDGLWHCWNAHGSLSGSTREECIEKLNNAATHTREFLKQADVVFITLGTAFVYYLKDASAMAGNGDAHGRAVANCHRQAPALFERRMISVEEAVQALENIVQDLHRLNPKSHIVFTVSPLRHMGDGAHNNTLSKATLQLAVDKVVKCGTEIAAATYFPSYEIVMDELRDYRFYNSDMVHLSETAEEYIFEQMVETYCNASTHENMAKVERFLKMANHRIQDANSPVTKEFQEKMKAQAIELEKQIPGLNLK
ncbi:MAG: GSCFA domain-containing protein, partial [Fibrobacter sp.]|nr:GSCFA domain-containing protein [Fibrobacter sp.]